MLLSLALGAMLLTTPQEPVRVSASLSAQRVPAGSTVVLLVSVETDGASPDEIPVPVLPSGLDLGPISDYSQLQVSFPGGRTRVTRREIVLLAREPGQYRIPELQVRVSGRTYATSALTLHVVGSAAATESSSDGPVRLRAWLEPETAYVGEQVLYQAEALFPEAIRLRQARSPEFRPPATTGLWVYDLPDAITVSLRVIGGEVFEVQNFRQVFFPLAAGTLTIPAARMGYEIRQGFAFTPDRREIVSQPVTLTVRPLPAGAPPEFAGAVGSYTVSAELSAAEVSAGEPVTFRVIVEGAGNVKGLPRPELPELNDADVFTGAEHTDIGVADGRVSGRKTMEWTVVPRTRGALELPPVSYAWFDPALGEYRTARTSPLTLQVLPARRGTGVDSALAPLRAEPAPARLRWTRSAWFAFAQLIPPMLLAGFMLLRTRPARRRAGSGGGTLAEAESLLDDPRACLDTLARQLRTQASPAARALLERVRAARYAPEAPTRAQCEAFIAEARAHSRTLHGSAVPTLALLLVLALAQNHAPAQSAFAAGVAAYAAGSYDEAARHFAQHVRAQPHDAAGWYNLGNAWEQQDERGRAVWAWLRALELQPRDRWARSNLRFTGATHALEDFAPRVPLATEEAIAAAALLWWCAWLALAVAWGRGRRSAGGAALAALLLLVPLLALVTARSAADDGAVSVTDLALRNAPDVRADAVAELEPGEPLRILRTRGDWLLARSYDLREGWVERSAVARL